MSKSTENPYLTAKEEWLERYGSYIKRAENWRLFAFGCLLITAISMTMNFVQATQSKVVPYTVEVDKHGQVLSVTRADEIGPVPKRIIQAEVANLIVNWRTVTADIGLQKKMVKRMSSFVIAQPVVQPKVGTRKTTHISAARRFSLRLMLKGFPFRSAQKAGVSNGWKPCAITPVLPSPALITKRL